MELGERTLLQRLHEAVRAKLPGIPADELLEQMREAAKGLDYPHQPGVPHHDVRPANLPLAGGMAGRVPVLEAAAVRSPEMPTAPTRPADAPGSPRRAVQRRRPIVTGSLLLGALAASSIVAVILLFTSAVPKSPGELAQEI